MEAILGQSARALRGLIGRKALSPVELLNACIARIERINPVVNAVVALDVDRARYAARKAEEAVAAGNALGPLHGLPVLIKDLTATAGLTTTRGSLVYKDHVPDADDLIVSRIRAAGGIILGKTNTPEFGAGSNTINRVYGATVNPFDPTLSCAGSSGGAAVALATDMVPLATGTDMGGSVRIPASFCGVVGHRTTPGLVPRPSRRFGWSPHSVDGPMARTVDDAALFLSAIAGFDARDPLAQTVDPGDLARVAPADPASLRVAFSEDLGCAPVCGMVREAFREKAARIAPIFARADWRDPDLGPVHATFSVPRAVEYLEAYGEYVDSHRDRAGPNVIANVDRARGLAFDAVGRAAAEQTALYQRMQHFFNDVDLLICPAASVVPFPVEELAVREIDGVAMESYFTWIAITYAITLTTHPATVIPCGLGPTGMPFGLQIVGPARGDLPTLAAALAIEQACAADPDLARPRPDLEALLARRDISKAGHVPAVLEAAP